MKNFFNIISGVISAFFNNFNSPFLILFGAFFVLGLLILTIKLVRGDK